MQEFVFIIRFINRYSIDTIISCGRTKINRITSLVNVMLCEFMFMTEHLSTIDL